MKKHPVIEHAFLKWKIANLGYIIEIYVKLSGKKQTMQAEINF